MVHTAHTAEFSACLGWDTGNWIAASDVFGRFHRNVFLRAVEIRLFGINHEGNRTIVGKTDLHICTKNPCGHCLAKRQS